MPIPIEVFESGVKSEKETWLTTRIIEFLKSNQDKAYSTDEVSFELKASYQSVRQALHRIAPRPFIITKLIGRIKYYAYNPQPKQEPDPSGEQIPEEEKEDLPQFYMEDY